ncbi:type I DNA topoisomerase [Corynebacterium sp. 320]|uniref:type I DNA topoisomerase n=1 Tax=Corynebacterium TaxID=1716 RepID=UPI00125CC3CF|nr:MULTISPECIES: type I DNA topoisomerase [Corynebacterium]KAB1502898.1 type I DNA topoisomerase [Corynebacterium sp. 320]KAB1552409.1 type I DNA topoisomerase [Corynebacterium sp. 321]KAB1554376.1 type I DNA topoisomerase [Corynebacterium sp. 319]KAB3526561.1 type I DNA topoisomerase [Corynebacterium sp. 250]KAB3539881.1 type I DNA topoisomerase [Corynebacterium sp. 366]
MVKRLVIVESATKARKIQPYLGDDYIVEASVGHIRDLPRGAADVPAKYKKEPWARLGVNVDKGFEALYVVSADKKKKVSDLKAKLKQVDELYLATDPDREGEAIAWHLLEVLKPKVPVRRMVFHEITKSAILEAAENTRELDYDLVDAQEARRVLDRLYGYEVSPVLWKKVMPRLSAGRVQSVATRVIVQRERERMAFVSANYWDLSAELALGADALRVGQESDHTQDPRSFEAKLVSVDGKRVAQGRDFGDDGALKTDAVVLNEARAHELAEGLKDQPMAVLSVEEKPYTRRPYPPFMTSTLQQEAGRKLRFTSERTMRIAQRLYENGHITYMRTDSTTLSQAGIDAARAQAKELYGAKFVADAPRQYSRKVKNSQEAHEAIRPAGETFSTPGQLSSQLDAEEFKLYELIWQRTVASQMADARGTSMKVTIGGNSAGGDACEFSATGRTLTFPGFLKAYVEVSQNAEGRDVADNAEKRLPVMAAGDDLVARTITADGHSTNPPARYTEASLVRRMEELGIGRPSTYASIIRTIQDRGYVLPRGNALVPSWTAFAVIGLMEQNFGALVDYDFTSAMEDELDAIATGDENREAWLKAFYFGDKDRPEGPTAAIPRQGGLQQIVGDRLESIDARAVNSLHLFNDDNGVPIVVRVGRYGAYLERIIPAASSEEGAEPTVQRANLPESMTPDELTLEEAERLFATPQGGRELGVNPASGRKIVAREGRYGPYVTEILGEDEEATVAAEAEKTWEAERDQQDAERAAEGKKPLSRETKTAQNQKAKRVKEIVEETLKPKTASLFQTMEPATVTLEEALKLLSLPREVGTDPSDGEVITAQNGRYGPYLKKGNDSRSLGSEEELFTITLDQARRIYAEPKRRGRAAAQPPLKQLGDNDVSGKPMSVKDGRFGAYVTDGETNASLRKGDTPETMTDARANELLSERRAKEAADEAAGKTTKSSRKGTKKAAKKTAKKATKKAAKKTAKKTAKKAAKKTAKKSATKSGAPTLTKRTISRSH